MDVYEKARIEAMKSTMRHRYGCVIIYRNKIIASGHNREKNISSKRNQCVL